MSKQTTIKTQYSTKVLLILFMLMHFIACIWINIGETFNDTSDGKPGSWLTPQIAADEAAGLEYSF